MKVILSLFTLVLSVVSEVHSAQQSELVLSAKPTVWHEGERQSIWLTMRYWGEIDGDNLNGQKLGDTKIVKEFTHQVRSFKNSLKVGSHLLRPMKLKFQGKQYTSNSLAVKVLPRIDGYRGVKLYFAQETSALNNGVQLVMYDYRDQKEDIKDIKLKENEAYEVWPHGGFTNRLIDHKGEKIWVRMRYFTLVFKKLGKHTLDISSLDANELRLVAPAAIEVVAPIGNVKIPVLPDFSKALPKEQLLSHNKMENFATYVYSTDTEFKDLENTFAKFLGKDWKKNKMKDEINMDEFLPKDGATMKFKGNSLYENPHFPKHFASITMLEMRERINNKKYILSITVMSP